MIAREAAELIAPMVDASFPEDKKRIYEILTNALNRAWSEGVWLGMSKEAFVNSFCDPCCNQIIVSPPGYDTLLAVNVNCQHEFIRSNYFQFHKNGYGTVGEECCHWNKDVMDIGTFPTIKPLNIKSYGCAKIGVRSLGPEPAGKTVRVNGLHTNGQQIFSYKQHTITTDTGTTCQCKSVSIQHDETEVIYGAKIPINQDFNYICDLDFFDVISIEKDVTLYGVEVLAIYPDNTLERIATLDPHETSSKYRRYMVPKSCVCNSCIHGIFKVSKQAKIVYDNQPILIDDSEALIALCKGWYKVYYKDELELGNAFIAQGLGILDSQKGQAEQAETTPIQVVGQSTMDVPPIFQIMN